jgi:cytochrome c peroxidase
MQVRTIFAILLMVLVAAAIAVGWSGVEVNPAHLKMFKPLPTLIAASHNPISEAKVNLGRMLYYEPRLSASQTISCNSCHELDKYGVDGEQFSDGFKGQKGDRNSPSVYNAAGHLAQFWDGRAVDVEEQAKGPVLNPVEMAMPSEGRVVAVLKSMPEYVELFRKAFPDESDPVTFDNMAKAIGVFERGLLTPSRWDQFLEGNKNALSSQEKAGFNRFMEVGCQTCHGGPYMGGSMFQKLGVVRPWPESHDLGRYKVTSLDPDKMVFKVPSLRNVEKTAPYYHDGSVATLQQAVKMMGEFQLGKTLSQTDIQQITAFMKTLTGEIPTEYIKRPKLPKSTDATPKPLSSD